MESVQRQTKIVPPELQNLKELPDSMKYVWKYFTDLNSKRTNNGFSRLPLQYSEIKAYFDLYGIKYEPVDIKILEVLDGVTLQHYNELAEKEEALQKAKANRK